MGRAEGCRLMSQLAKTSNIEEARLLRFEGIIQFIS